MFFIIRAGLVSFWASCINDESKKLIKILRDLPSHRWNTETRRFYNDATNDTIALTGLGFFFITRKLILSVRNILISIYFNTL